MSLNFFLSGVALMVIVLSLKYKSCLNLLLFTSSSKFLFVAAIIRVSTFWDLFSPTLINSPSSITLSNLACVSIGSSPTSSKKIVPLFAASKYPFRLSIAPVNEPFLWPKSSPSIIPEGIAAQLTIIKFSNFLLLFLCIALAIRSLPEPDSPLTNTEISVFATWPIKFKTSIVWLDSPIIPTDLLILSISTFISFAPFIA